MAQYFVFSSTLSPFLLSVVNIKTITGIVIACIVIGTLAVLLEVGKLWQTHLRRKANMNPLTYGRTEQNITERSPLIAPMLIPASVSQINKRWLKYHTLKTFIYICQVIVGYLLMLAVMTYNAWLFIAVIISSGLGYYIFGALQDHLIQPQELVPLNHTDELLSEPQSSEPMQPSTSRTSHYDTFGEVRT